MTRLLAASKSVYIEQFSLVPALHSLAGVPVIDGLGFFLLRVCQILSLLFVDESTCLLSKGLRRIAAPNDLPLVFENPFCLLPRLTQIIWDLRISKPVRCSGDAGLASNLIGKSASPDMSL
ncbi:hypothetical protein MPTK1_8g13600 [Marchantia polymorpha subsp. ruderalis]|uniref:Uncharacterized protein n=1 Tax=Marchantia polymorpha TaxID=3197 RepID=A0A2R6WCH6_MARPO|nr:hypothetical protein MARPO_0110s0041 [Marchantia polymorpha]BBN19781.1 hypothetical protein Mp_8g13600 [Marchantia polymorpha subsp. ruderalis]|eukprot:PTQ31552.1 hypothetical protein MARPO_0110s0041 [Marchantia polymorpha]